MNALSRAGYFGEYGGRFVPETLSFALEELSAGYDEARLDPAFRARLDHLLTHYVGRATPLYFAERLTAHAGGARIFLKREDLNHTGAHKINNAIGQALLAQRLGKERIIAETGAGQHGVATATACALLGLPCRVFMGEVDVARQRPNVQRMELLGAEVIPVASGSRTLKDAINAAMRQWVSDVRDTHYLVGSVVGPDPFPRMVRDFQSVIGRETRAQCLELLDRLPDVVVACVGGGSNAMGMFHPLVDDPIALVGVEAAGHGVDTAQHAATLTAGRPGVLHGARTIILQDDDGQILEAHSISAGLDYPGVGPEHAYLRDRGRVIYESVTDRAALAAFGLLARLEGIVPALESAHAVAHAIKVAAELPKDRVLVVNLSGRGDKDLDHVMSLGAEARS
ncbi:MAG: tryptophan synthase subunit beta [Vicinamibacteria bacterium]|nr:tryptophan synthase subunit beta [Vicinamibacteria bacterium]MBP9945216.1 tryptophan synthase subunit beta [Vicinamibacteria bacterium]